VSIRKAFRFLSTASFVSVTIWACSSGSPNTGFGGPTNNGGGSNTSNNNGNTSNNGQTYGSGNSTNNNTGFGNTSTNGGTTNNNTGGNTTTTAGGTTTPAGGNTGCPAQTGAYSTATSCAATMAASALSLSNCFYTSANPSTMGEGYAYVFGDGTSSVCLDSTKFCTKGSVGISSSTVYGAGIGVSLNQSSGGGTAATVTPTATGLSYSISAMPANGLQISITSDTGACTAAASPSGAGCCTRLTGSAPASGTIPWNSFVPGCFNADAGTTGFAPSEGLDKINFQVIAGTAATPFDFCLTQLSY
jgi:hypothetical protein